MVLRNRIAFMIFLSTPSARRATRHASRCLIHKIISIHALREEGDSSRAGWMRPKSNFYPRPPRGGRRKSAGCPHGPIPFLSTPSARRATLLLQHQHPERQISIHALREEGDERMGLYVTSQEYFYPRPPRGGRLGRFRLPWCRYSISIHALREEGDPYVFLVTYPATISIHALREEGDGDLCTGQRKRRYFYPRPPRGGRHVEKYVMAYGTTISIHALREEGDFTPKTNYKWADDFYPRPPRGGRPG